LVELVWFLTGTIGNFRHFKVCSQSIKLKKNKKLGTIFVLLMHAKHKKL